MNKEEAIQVLKSFANLDEDIELKQAIETVLKELEDSISKDKIRGKIEEKKYIRRIQSLEILLNKAEQFIEQKGLMAEYNRYHYQDQETEE